MTAHTFEIQTQASADESGKPTGVFRYRYRYRWRCSCAAFGPWKAGGKESGQHARAARAARNGGEKHAAAMGRR